MFAFLWYDYLVPKQESIVQCCPSSNWHHEMLRNNHLQMCAVNWWDLRLWRWSWNFSVNSHWNSCPSELLFSYGWRGCCLHHSCQTPLSCWTPFWTRRIGYFAGWDETWLPWVLARHSWTPQWRDTSGKLSWSQLGTWEEKCSAKACACESPPRTFIWKHTPCWEDTDSANYLAPNPVCGESVGSCLTKVWVG